MYNDRTCTLTNDDVHIYLEIEGTHDDIRYMGSKDHIKSDIEQRLNNGDYELSDRLSVVEGILRHLTVKMTPGEQLKFFSQVPEFKEYLTETRSSLIKDEVKFLNL